MSAKRETGFRGEKGVWLVLGGGGARGWAHLGVFRALREAGWPVKGIAGTSFGALAGAIFASGKDEAFETFARHINFSELLHYFVEMSFNRGGLIDGRKLARLLQSYMAERIEDMTIPFRAVATELRSGREVVYRTGASFEAVRASIAVPGIFTPVSRADDLLVDGGLCNPLPVSVARDMGRGPVVAVDINAYEYAPVRLAVAPAVPRPPSTAPATRAAARLPPAVRAFVDRMDRQMSEMRDTLATRWQSRGRQPGMLDVIGNSVRIMEARITEGRLATEPPDLLVRPRVGAIGFMDFHRAADTIEAGYTAMREAMSGLQAGPAEQVQQEVRS